MIKLKVKFWVYLWTKIWSASFSMGFAYSLSYEVSLSMSFQGSYSHKSDFVLFTPSTGEETTSTTSSQMSGIMNFALGLRVSPKTITNINVGFGMTDLGDDGGDGGNFRGENVFVCF